MSNQNSAPGPSLQKAPPVATPSDVPPPVVHFGGPDRPPRALRDLLLEKIDAVPGGGTIDWLTYYFRDEGLAAALVRASRRGVRVRVCVEGRPRRAAVNARVIEMLGDRVSGIGEGLCARRHVVPRHLHTKLYCFSHPHPTALAGSFNPSGDARPDAELTADIGDQDGGHNLLVELTDPLLVAGLVEKIAELHLAGGRFTNARSIADASVTSGGVEAIFFPLLARSPLIPKLESLAPDANLRIAASHFRDPFVSHALARIARRGVEVTVLTGDTLRRTPRRREERLRDAGIKVVRFRHPDGLPMHAKFMLASDGGEQWSSFGSYNFTLTSRLLNHELLMFSSDAGLYRALDRRWHEILAGTAP